MRLQDELLVDIILCLCRAMLEALELTNRRFRVLVQKRAKGLCLRELEVAELYANDTFGPPNFITKLVTPPIGRRDGALQRETLSLENATTEETCRWFVNRLRHCVVVDKLTFIMQTDTPDLVESVKGTVRVKKALCWAVRRTIGLDNAFRFLSSFIDLQEVEIWSYYDDDDDDHDDRSLCFTDDWFKLFESLGVYRVATHESTTTASTDALSSFLFGVSSAPASENRILHTSFRKDRWKALKPVAEQLIEAAVCCTSAHKTTLFLDHRRQYSHADMEYLSVLAKYKEDLLRYTGAETEHNGIDSTYDGCVLNFHKERFRIQVFCYKRGLQIRRACVEDVDDGFFPAWLDAATAHE